MVGLGRWSQANGLDFGCFNVKHNENEFSECTYKFKDLITCECNRAGQLDQGNIVDNADGFLVGVNGVLCRSDFNASRFLGSGQTNIVGAQVDVEEDGVISAIYTIQL